MRHSIDEVRDILYGGKELVVSAEERQTVEEGFAFLKEFANEKVIYGINTGFGPMAQWRVDDKYLKDLQYNIIRSHSTGAGEPLEDRYVRAAMIARLGSFLRVGSRGAYHQLRLYGQFPCVLLARRE